MSQTVVFAIGAAVWALTVWGTVMAGGLKLTKVQIQQTPEFEKEVESSQLDKPLPTDVEY